MVEGALEVAEPDRPTSECKVFRNEYDFLSDPSIRSRGDLR